MSLRIKLLVTVLLALVLFVLWTVNRANNAETQAEREFPPTGQILMVDGHRVHAQIMGSGPDLVLLHGSGSNLRDMTFSLAPKLAENYRVIIFDRPGHGYSSHLNPAGASLVEQADLLVRASNQLGAEKPIVMGHSYGGAVALAWALHHPDALSALVPVAAPSHPWTTGLSAYYTFLSHPITGPLLAPLITAFVGERRINSALNDAFHPNPVPSGYGTHFGPGLTLRRSSLRANAMQRANLLSDIEKLHSRYEEISVPTEIIHGLDDDTVNFTLHSEALFEAILGAALIRLSNVGHMPHHSSEIEIIRAIDSVAKRAGLRPAP